MPRIIIDLKSGINQNNFKNGDMLVYDEKRKEFYTVTEKSFFDKTNSKINELKKAYDEKIAKIEQEKNEILKSNEEFTLNIQESNKKLIEMVENFIKGGKE